MRILYLSATHILATPGGTAEFSRRKQLLNELASPGTQIDMWENETGPLSIQTAADEEAAVPGLLANIRKAHGYDAVITGCFGDPGLFELRKISDIPVLGPGICGMHAASLIADKFSVLTPVAESVQGTRNQARTYGLLSKLASVRALDIPVLMIRQNRQKALERAAEVAKHCVSDDGAEALVLGCMSMAFQRMDRELSQELRIPVINPLIPLVRFAEAMAACARGQA